MKLQMSVGMLVCGLVLAGCSKDSETMAPVTETAPEIVGKWTVVAGGGTRKHLVFKADNSFAFLNEHQFGIRTIELGIFQAVSGTIDLGNDQYPSLYALAIQHDTLTLSTPQKSITCYRNTSAPADTQWARIAGVLSTFDAPIQEATDIAVSDSILFYGNGYSAPYLFRINLFTGTVDTSLNVSVSAWAVEWDGTSLWCGSNGHDEIHRINPTTGTTLSSSKPMGAWIYGIAWDGSKLWCSSNNEQSLYRYNPVADIVEETYKLETAPAGLAYVGGFLYVCAGGVINKCTTSPLAVVDAYRIPGVDVFGIAHDGASFLVSSYAQGNAKIHRVLLP